MALQFDNLAQNLKPVATAVGKYLTQDLGVTKLKAETPIDDSIHWVPTISGVQTDHHQVYVDVTDAGLSFSMSSYLANLMQSGLPALIYVAIPDATSETKAKTYEDATNLGIGILKVSSKYKVTMFRRATSASLLSLRRVVPKDHANKYKQSLHDAQETFLNGDPVGGCQRVHQEIEDLSRRVCKATYDKSLWDSNCPTITNWETGSWKGLLPKTTRHLSSAKAKNMFPDFNDSVLYTVAGMPDRRNLESHKPKNKAGLQKRDRECRTVFENGIDTFKELQVLAKVLKVK